MASSCCPAVKGLRALLAALLLLAVPLGTVGVAPSSVVLLGSSGSGKSETSNTLVGLTRFSVSGGLESETQVPQSENTTFRNRDWQ
ncbi:unnamed protein product, partial [Polarella glacialis]